MSSGSKTIQALEFTEVVDTTLVGGGGPGTSSFVGISGTVTVLATTGGAIAPVFIPFDDSNVIYGPTNSFTLPGDFGATAWTAFLSIDIESVVPDATKVMLSLDNNLFVFSEAGTSAHIQKKAASGPTIIIDPVPEPATALLFLVGITGLAVAGRRRR